MRTAVFDIETNGLLDKVTKLHCLVIKDLDTGEVFRCADPFAYLENVHRNLEWGLRKLKEYDRLIGHNIIDYDLPVLKKLYPWFDVPEEVAYDTLVMSRMLWPDLMLSDGKRVQAGVLPPNNRGSHALEAWGYRLGQMKGEFKHEYQARRESEYKEYIVAKKAHDKLLKKLMKKDPEGYLLEQLNAPPSVKPYEDGEEWLELNQDMLDYNEQDVVVTEALYLQCEKKGYSEQARVIEHKTAFICSKMTRTGWKFNEKKAVALYGMLEAERAQVVVDLQNLFKPSVKGYKGRSKTLAMYTAEEVMEQCLEVPEGDFKFYAIIPFNPGSRPQVIERLKAKYKWEPQEYSDAGQPKIDDEVLSRLPYPEAKLLARYYLLSKRIGQVATGKNGWLKLVSDKGRIHGRYNPCGAVTGRATHSTPNLGQVPAVRSPYGEECRECFEVLGDRVALGADMSGIELRNLGHYLVRYDGGSYARTVVEGKSSEGTDVHTLNTKAFGFKYRDSGKTGIYAFLYGAAGAEMFRIAEIDARRDGRTLTTEYKTEKAQKAYGNKLIQHFLSNTPALKKLREAVAKASAKGHLIGMDGRKLTVRSSHAALNVLLQGLGAVASKVWMIEVVEEAARRGWVWTEDERGDYAMLGWVHDELQFSVKPEIAEEFGKMVCEAATKAGEILGMKVRVDAEYSIGKNWKDTH